MQPQEQRSAPSYGPPAIRPYSSTYGGDSPHHDIQVIAPSTASTFQFPQHRHPSYAPPDPQELNAPTPMRPTDFPIPTRPRSMSRGSALQGEPYQRSESRASSRSRRSMGRPESRASMASTTSRHSRYIKEDYTDPAYLAIESENKSDERTIKDVKERIAREKAGKKQKKSWF